MKKLVVKEYDTNKIIKEFDIHGKSNVYIENLDFELNKNLDQTIYYTTVIESKKGE